MLAPRAPTATVALALALAACVATPAVDEPWVSARAPHPPSAAPDRLVVVSYNVHLGAHPAELAEAMLDGGLGDADVVLIQELEDHRAKSDDPASAAVLAERLGLGVVYAPARVGDDGKGTHGLAVLSRWPLVGEPVRVRLPAHDLGWHSRPRIALGVTLDVAGTAVQVWNVHLDTRLAVEERRAQLAPVLERAQGLPGLAVLGGDFNTWARVHADAVDAEVRAWGFATPTAELTATFPGGWRWPPTPMRLDAIYTRGFPVRGAGVDRVLRCGRERVRCSDHDPIWVELAWPRLPSR